jgi:hypothetical protein
MQVLKEEVEVTMKKLVRECLPMRTDLFEAGTADALVRLNNFASSIRDQRFDEATGAILSRGTTKGTTAELVVRIADALRANRSGSESIILEKSLQETLFSMGDFDLDERLFGENAQSFVRESGCRGLMQLFLELHLSNVIWIQLDDSSEMPADHESLKRLPKAIERLCRQAVKATTASWEKWPQLDESSASRLLHSLRSEMANILAGTSTSLSKAG